MPRKLLFAALWLALAGCLTVPASARTYELKPMFSGMAFDTGEAMPGASWVGMLPAYGEARAFWGFDLEDHSNWPLPSTRLPTVTRAWLKLVGASAVTSAAAVDVAFNAATPEAYLNAPQPLRSESYEPGDPRGLAMFNELELGTRLAALSLGTTPPRNSTLHCSLDPAVLLDLNDPRMQTSTSDRLFILTGMLEWPVGATEHYAYTGSVHLMVETVPEPAGWQLGAFLAMGGVGWMRRRRSLAGR